MLHVFLRINYRGLLFVFITLFAVQEVNKNSDFLPNTTIGYVILDSCKHIQKALKGAVSLLSENFASKEITKMKCTPHVVLGPSTSTIAVVLSHLMDLFSIPLVSNIIAVSQFIIDV